MDKFKFGNKLLYLREEKNLSQKQLASLLDVSDKAISKWENGQSIPRMETLEKLCEILGTTIENLISDDESYTERRKIKREIFQNKDVNSKNIFFFLGIGSLAVTLLFCIIEVIVYFAFGKSNLADTLKQNISLLTFPLGLLTAYAIIKTFGVNLIKGITNLFKSTPNCVESENYLKQFGNFVHNVSAILSLVPILILILSSEIETAFFEYIIFYLISIILLSIFFFTTEYENIDLYFTNIGLFEKSVDYGDFHLYASLENLQSNLAEVRSGLTDILKVTFTIGDKKYKTIFDGEDVTKITAYLNLSFDRKEKNIKIYKPKPVNYIITAIGAVTMIFGFIMFMSNMQIGTFDVDYTKPQTSFIALDGNTGVIEYKEKIFAFTEQNCAVDVFDLSGNFLFANQVPIHQNGMSHMYLYEDNMYITAKDHTIYRYDLSGKYLGKCLIDYKDDESFNIILQYDEKDNLADSVIVKDTVSDIAYFDEENIDVVNFDSGDYTYASYQDGKLKNEREIVTDDYDNIASYVKGAVYSDVLGSGEDELEYFTFRGSLYSLKGDELTLLYKVSFFSWYRHSIFSVWFTGALGMGIIFFSSLISRRRFKKKNKI